MPLPELRLPVETPGPRYLFSFRPQQLPTLRWPVVVIGGGGAGASAALEAADHGREVLLVRKPPAKVSNTRWAQGGIAAAMAKADSPERHSEDTIAVGCGLSEPEVVSRIVSAGPDTIRWLEHFDVTFDQRPEHHDASERGDGRSLSREGGHSFPRVLSAGGDATGKAIQSGLDRAVMAHERITVRDDLRALDLLVSNGRCIGVLTQSAHGDPLIVLGGSTILATGGAGQLYRETTNPHVATGDGLAMAWRAGATLRDLEFVQFHPTTLYIAGAARVLITEALRGAGAVLVDREGARVMEGEDPALDLAPRDVVSRAILRRMVATNDTHVYLDASRVEGGADKLFPGIARMCADFGLDISRDPIPVRPGAHYFVGGVRTDADAATSLPGLLACGEVTSTGLHGANRLASNSLLEAMVMGRRAGTVAAATCDEPEDKGLRSLDDDPTVGPKPDAEEEVPLNLDDMIYSLKALTWRQVGLIREAFMLRDAVEKVDFWERVLHSRPQRNGKHVDLVNMLLVSRLLALSALAREESRGTHYRRDFDQRNDEDWLCHTVVSRGPST